MSEDELDGSAAARLEVDEQQPAARPEHVALVCFFFSSRRRHTRFDCDWSSDVCSSDLHSDCIANHRLHAGGTDQPIAALITDLKRTGLWDETLLIWGGEFGRTPTSEGVGRPGRDHNPFGFSMWLAGAGVKGGQTIGATDELGFNAVEDRCHVADLHATILHLLGLDHTRLTYFYQGLDQRLTGVRGRVVGKALA